MSKSNKNQSCRLLPDTHYRLYCDDVLSIYISTPITTAVIQILSPCRKTPPTTNPSKRGVVFHFTVEHTSVITKNLKICFQEILGSSSNSLNCLSNKYPQQQEDGTFLEKKANDLKEPTDVSDFCAAPSPQRFVAVNS